LSVDVDRADLEVDANRLTGLEKKKRVSQLRIKSHITKTLLTRIQSLGGKLKLFVEKFFQHKSDRKEGLTGEGVRLEPL
jgi:hypothetical protein